jgi:hypothetical protein
MRPTGLGHGVYQGQHRPREVERDPERAQNCRQRPQALVAEAPEGQGSGMQRRGVALGTAKKPRTPRTRNRGSGVTNTRRTFSGQGATNDQKARSDSFGPPRSPRYLVRRTARPRNLRGFVLR